MRLSLFLPIAYIFVSRAAISSAEIPKQFLAPGIVVVLSRACHFSTELANFLRRNNFPHQEIYVEDDKEANDYIVKNCDGRVPWVYENGHKVGDGIFFMSKYPHLLPNKNLAKSMKLLDNVLDRQCIIGKN
ncbi:glutaredoxin-like protein [Vairimorpha necatrix]|uniref:Glutaredoxin-like protein n=1 Tax=Vairimorpha necatrix TaxID=6039 RepID=A0AAX4JDL3_9MICR